MMKFDRFDIGNNGISFPSRSGPWVVWLDAEKSVRSQKESDAAIVEAAGCIGCVVYLPWLSRHIAAAAPNEHKVQCPIFLAEQIRSQP